MTVFTVKDWKNATTHEGGGDTTTPISAAALEDLETRVSSSGGRTITSAGATDEPLILKGNAAQTADLFVVQNSAAVNYLTISDKGAVELMNDLQTAGANLTLGNITSGQNPAHTPQLYFEKDGTLRWSMGIDVQVGDQGDLALWHSNAYSGGSSGDFVYVTDEDYPGFAIGHGTVDRTLATQAQFTVSNPSGAQRPAARIIQNWPGNQPTLVIYRDSSFQTAPFLECRDYDTEALKASITTDGVLTVGNGQVTSGVYTPTITEGTNVAATTEIEAQYLRVGDVVTVGGMLEIDATAAAVSDLEMSLPIASNFADGGDLGGVCTSMQSGNTICSLGINASVANDRARFDGYIGITSNAAYGFHFTYRII